MSANFVTTIDTSLESKLRSDLLSQGFTFSKPAYTLFSAKKAGISCTLYASGKLMVQGKEKDAFIEYYLEPEILKTFTYSNPKAYLNFTPRIGVDEAGKGDVFGPLCVAGLYANKEQISELADMGVKDSKTMNDVQIQKIAKQIRAKFTHNIISLFPTKYNELYSKFNNLNHLLGWGHASVIENVLKEVDCENALIDQFAAPHVVTNALARKNLDIALEQRHKGESDVVVAGASMLARDAFLRGMHALSEEAEMILPKGAANHVKLAGKKLLAKIGQENLHKYVKMHFKTVKEICS